MPELPEVETVCRLIRPDLVGRTLGKSTAHWPRTLGGQSPAAFDRAVRGTRVKDVRRRGKFIVIDLARDATPTGALLIHLRMSGRLHVEATDVEPGPYTRVSCELEGGHRLDFVDVRKFGRVLYRRDPDEVLSALGPEPLEEGFTGAWLLGELRRRRRMLKPLLLDQTFLAGLGNIYVDEALFQARLHPLVSSERVSPQKARALHNAIRETLAAAIEREGSSFDTFYRTPAGQPGSYQHQFRVYGRQGRPCRRCGRKIAKIVVGQRGTHLCRRCQPVPRRS